VKLDLFDYSILPAELRLYALGLEPPNPVGRPRVLSSFRQRLEVALRWGETANRLAVHGRSTQRPELAPILKQIGRLRAKGALPWRIAELSRKADKIGRHSQTPILPPDETKPAIDKMVANDLGLTERMVRKIRSDKRLIPFMPPPLWVPRDWERADAQRAWVKRRARALLTPEHLAKVDRGEIVLGERDGGLAILDMLDGIAHLLTAEQYRKAREFQSRCYEGGLGHFVLGRWLGREDDPLDDGIFPPVMRRLPYRGWVRWQNVVLPKIRSQSDYNREIIERIGLPGLKFLRAVLYEGRLIDRRAVEGLAWALDQI
jgi:hypothetical protein